MDAVSSILLRYLLQHRAVAVEGIGTLHTVRSGARLLPGQRLDPPRRMPELAETEYGDLPLTEIVAAELAVDSVTADGLCRRWREEAYAGAEAAGLSAGSMLLEGVGTIEADPERGTSFFYADPLFLELLNPLPAEPLVVPSPARRSTALVPAPGNSPRTGGRPRPRRSRPRGKNPHNYTVSFFAVLIVLAALGYLCYYLWKHTGLFSDFLPR
ncbi:hypothetical protein [uncultured Rikenella sp.]|uniref:hypothetical protein n=1 Tax=uncultured Rikenella sp. TaxID=368003 RepID=UPI00262308CE|nr:hypothetical protein [uncultured Rikenella sp.]